MPVYRSVLFNLPCWLYWDFTALLLPLLATLTYKIYQYCDMATLLGVLNPADGDSMTLLNFGNYLTVNRHKIPEHLHQHHNENLKSHTHIFIFSTTDIHEQKNYSK
jgi:hypothetical protein